MIKSISIKTKFGWISAFEEKDKIIKVKFGKYKSKSVSKNLKKFKTNLNNFFTRKSKSLKCNCSIKGSLIQKKVWKELKNIGLGKTKTYGEIAKKHKLSPRHVGKICSQNNIVLLMSSNGCLMILYFYCFCCPRPFKSNSKHIVTSTWCCRYK